MNRILILLAMLVVGPPAEVLGGDLDEWASGESFSTFDISAYKRLCNHSNCFLVADDDDLWIYGGGFGYGTSTTDFSERVLIRCRQMSRSPSSCRVIDRFGESDFVKSLHLPVPTEQFCYETYHKEYGEAKWLEMLEKVRLSDTAGALSTSTNESSQLIIRCAPYLSADYTTWIGNDTPQYLVTVDRTIEEYEECYSAVQDGNVKMGRRTYTNWQDVVSDSWEGTANNDASGALVSQCSPFLSSDQLTWAAPTPDEVLSKTQSVAASPAPTVESTYCYKKDSRGLDVVYKISGTSCSGGNKAISKEEYEQIVAKRTKVWCGTVDALFLSTAQECASKNGVYSNEYETAVGLRNILLTQNSLDDVDLPEPTSSEVSKSQPTEADKKIELEFWQSIKDSNDAEMYRAYLRKFPSGVYAELAKIKIKKLAGTSTSVAKASIPNLDYGEYYALVIGNNEYQDLTDLRSAVNDAKVVSTVLEVDYGFNVKLLENASRKDILRALKNLRQTVGPKDNVLIYYAGHGYLDDAADQGYWLPVDSERNDDSNWIPTDRVAGQVKAMKAKHVMVVADSCFSGTITRAIKIEQRTPEWLSEIVKKKARTALTSGGLEPVLDTGSGNHSAFAHAFISLLEENNGVLDALQLFSKLRPKVMVNSTQTPQYGKIHMAGDDGGDFLFVRR